MRKLLSFILICLVVLGALQLKTASEDRDSLRSSLIRLHVVADSDEAVDQERKLLVRDAVTAYLEEALTGMADMEGAKAFISSHLEEIRTLAEDALLGAGCSDGVVVTLGEETFDTRQYETFSLPAGIYESLRITIGEGAGKNWWCVVFPSLCYGRSAAEFEDTAVAAGLTEGLTKSLEGEPRYRIRFFLADALGKLENMFFSR